MVKKSVKISIFVIALLVIIIAVSAGGIIIKLNSEDAKIEFLNMMKNSPEQFYYYVGAFHYQLGDDDGAITAFNKAIQAKEDYGKAYQARAIIYKKHDKLEDAIVNFEQAVTFDNTANNNFDLALSLVDRFRQKEATGKIVHEDLNDLNLALDHYKTVIELEPGFPHAEQNAAIVESVLQEYETAFSVKNHN